MRDHDGVGVPQEVKVNMRLCRFAECQRKTFFLSASLLIELNSAEALRHSTSIRLLSSRLQCWASWRTRTPTEEGL